MQHPGKLSLISDMSPFSESTGAQREEETPLPMGMFKRFVNAFHVVFIGALLFSLCIRWRGGRFTGSWADAAVLFLVTAQIALYVLFMVRQWKPVSAVSWWLGYVASGYLIWLAEWHFEPGLHWPIWAYLGQIFGVFRPRFSIPVVLVFLLTFFGVQAGGTGGLARMQFWEWVGVVATTVSFVLFGLFFYHLVTTSSERAKLIQKLEAAHKQLEAARERDAELATLKERERLARELHDSLGHGLVTLTVQLEAAQRLVQTEPARANALIDEMKRLTRDSMDQLRRALAGLRAPGLGDRGLVDALESLAHRNGRGLSVRFTSSGCPATLPLPVAEALWRVAQEGITNVEKHANCREASIRLSLTAREAALTVVDNGTGIAPGAENKPGHYGLRGLRERVEGLGGTLRISSEPTTGAAVEARIPLML